MRLSIIVPVYNNENTLARCLQSILKQSFRDYQLILVDDASTDGSGLLCDRYVQADHRVQVIHKKSNVGLSEARNSGIRKAHGEYITFIDADDYIAAGTLEALMEILMVHHEYDMLEYPVWERFGHPRRQHRLQFKATAYDNIDDYWFRCKAYLHSYACNKIYRTVLFSDVRFPVGRKFEDIYTLPQLLSRCNYIATTNVGLYYYCYNPAGITAKASGSDLNQLLQAHLPIVGKLHAIDPQYTNAHAATYYAHVLNIQLDVYERLPHCKLSLPVLPYRSTVKLQLLNLLGLQRLCRINKLFHQITGKHRS